MFVGAESTLDSARQPTHQPTHPEWVEHIWSDASNYRVIYPQKYVSVRITVEHHQWSIVESHLHDCAWYISYPHTGSNGTNPHFHLFLPGNTPKDVERYRKRFKSAGFSGNKQLSAKLVENGLQCAIQYGSKEGTKPYFRGISAGSWINFAPRWLKANLKDNLDPFRKRKRDDVLENMSPINGKNCLYLCWQYRQRKQLASQQIGDIILHMLDSGSYYICPSWARSPLPTFFKDVFLDSCKKQKLTFAGTQKVWLNALFRDRNF